jgi:hypothetical protein
MKRINSKIQKLISSSFAFLLTLLFVTLFVCLGFSIGVFNNTSIISKINESNYYNDVYNELNTNAEAIVQKAGFPTTVLQDIITVERVFVGGKNYINNILNGEESQINTDKLREDLKNNIDQYLNDQGITRTDEMNTNIEAMQAEIESQYRSGIEFQFVNYYMEYKAHYVNLIKILMPVIILLIGILCYFVIRMHSHKHRGLRYINYALISSSCMMILAATYLLISKRYVKMDITPEYYSNFINTYLKWDVLVFLYIGGIGLTISIAIISFTGYLKNKIQNS